MLGLVLVAGGALAIILGILRIRGPLATIRRLDATEADLARYEAWRGRSTAVEADGPTGADIMRDQMRQRVVMWGAVVAGGAVAVVAGLILR
jgi:hypothetical protein